MLSAVLHSPEAIDISIRIIEAFVAMRHFLLSNAQVFQRFDRIEYKQLEADHRIEELFRKWFAVSLMSETDPEMLLSRLEEGSHFPDVGKRV